MFGEQQRSVQTCAVTSMLRESVARFNTYIKKVLRILEVQYIIVKVVI
jgi:hypothetical protein